MATRLLAASHSAADPPGSDVVIASERLRLLLTRFAGADGFESLQRRAWTLASAEVSALRALRVEKGGRLEGWEQLAAHRQAEAAETPDPEPAAGEPAVLITAHLLELMITFIGRPLTLRLLDEAWPNLFPYDSQSTTEADQ